MSTREICRNDYKQYLLLRPQLGNYPINLTDSEWWDRYIQMKNQGSSIYVITDQEDTKLLATCKLIIEIKFTNPVGHIEDVVVDSNYRNSGLGKKIVQYALQEAELKGCYKCILDCEMSLENFYGKCGMCKKGLLMTKIYNH